jgi:hypothetical protein
MEFLPQALKNDRAGNVDVKYYEPRDCFFNLDGADP